MSRLGLLQNGGVCECDDPSPYTVEHQELIYDKNGDPSGSYTTTDERCRKCGGVV